MKIVGPCVPMHHATYGVKKVSSTKNDYKTRLNKEKLTFSRYSLAFLLSLFFHYSTTGADVIQRARY